MKKWVVIALGMGFLVSCSMGGFNPPKPYYFWFSKDRKYPSLIEFWYARKKDMLSCGMDPVDGESDRPEVNLCLEQKGWRLEEGPVCEEVLMWDRPLCIEWRAKHSSPDTKPWGCKDNPDDPICIQTGSKR